jgi:hypothetical protein
MPSGGLLYQERRETNMKMSLKVVKKAVEKKDIDGFCCFGAYIRYLG